MRACVRSIVYINYTTPSTGVLRATRALIFRTAARVVRTIRATAGQRSLFSSSSDLDDFNSNPLTNQRHSHRTRQQNNQNTVPLRLRDVWQDVDHAVAAKRNDRPNNDQNNSTCDTQQLTERTGHIDPAAERRCSSQTSLSAQHTATPPTANARRRRLQRVQILTRSHLRICGRPLLCECVRVCSVFWWPIVTVARYHSELATSPRSAAHLSLSTPAELSEKPRMRCARVHVCMYICASRARFSGRPLAQHMRRRVRCVCAFARRS